MAHEESKRFLEQYYSQEFPPEHVRAWCALGSPERCVEHLLTYRRLGFSDQEMRRWLTGAGLKPAPLKALPSATDEGLTVHIWSAARPALA